MSFENEQEKTPYCGRELIESIVNVISIELVLLYFLEMNSKWSE